MDVAALAAMLGGQTDPQALASALRGQRQLGLLGQLSGDKVLAPVGAGMIKDTQFQQAQDQESQGARLRAAIEAQKNAAEEQYRQGLLGQGQQKIDLDRAELALKRQALNTPKPAAPPNPDDLRKEFQGQQPYKDFNQVSAAYKKIQTTSDTGAGDMSLIFGYMKLLDPNSTVREGEYATAANAGSVPQSLIASYNRIISGEKLAPEVRKQFRTEAEKVYGAQKSEYDRIASNYARLAKDRGLNPGDVVFGWQDPGTAPQGAAPVAPADEDAAAKAWAAQNPNDPRAAAILQALQARGR